MVRYSTRATRGLAFLFRKYNDIDVYVEDETCKGMYEVLFGRMLEHKAKISRVFQLKGKEQVIEICRADQEDTSRRRIYIIDGDFDCLLRKRPEKNLKYLYQLKVYCSENLIFTKEAIIEVAYESLTNLSKDEASNICEYSKLLGEVSKLVDLFTLYVVAYKLKIPVQTTGFNASRLLEKDRTKLSMELIKKREEEVKNKLLAEFPKNKVQDEFRRVKRKLQKKPLKFISGKSYLLPFLYHYLVVQTKYHGTLDQLKIRLARYCKLSTDKGLVTALKTAAQQN